MPYGRGYGAGRGVGWGRGGGYGFGFRGSSPPWPYVGRGRGGLPRCGYFFDGPAVNWPGYQYPGAAPVAGDLDSLKSAVASIKDHLEALRSRISELENK